MLGHDLPNRRSIRLRGYDYANAGAYFVTICVQHRELFLGEVVNDDVVLSTAGRQVDTIWNTLPDRFPTMDIDAYVIMPNHLHGIILLGAREIDLAGGPRTGGRPNRTPGGPRTAPTGSGSADSSLATVIGAFKSISAIACNRALGRQGQPFWQRNYYERIIRNDHELDRIRQYIFDNPITWATDADNPCRLRDNHRNP